MINRGPIVRLFLFVVALAGALAPIFPTVSVATSDGPPDPTTIPSAAHSRQFASWYALCARRVARAHGKCNIIFIGDSITQNFESRPSGGWYSGGYKVWDKYYAPRHAIDFGVGADGTEHVLWRLIHFHIHHLHPKVEVILIGTNDTQYAPRQIAAGVRAVIIKTRQVFHGVKIILVSLTPTSRNTATIVATNRIIRHFANGRSIFYFNLFALMPRVGNSWKGLGPDQLHLTEAGYTIWATHMQPLLNRLLRRGQ